MWRFYMFAYSKCCKSTLTTSCWENYDTTSFKCLLLLYPNRVGSSGTSSQPTFFVFSFFLVNVQCTENTVNRICNNLQKLNFQFMLFYHSMKILSNKFSSQIRVGIVTVGSVSLHPKECDINSIFRVCVAKTLHILLQYV